MTNLTDAELAAMKARADAATPGPWVIDDGDIVQDFAVARKIGPHEWERVGVAPGETLHDYDAEFIAHAREDVPALLVEVAALRKQIARRDAVVNGVPHECDLVRICTCWKAEYDAAKKEIDYE